MIIAQSTQQGGEQQVSAKRFLLYFLGVGAGVLLAKLLMR